MVFVSLTTRLRRGRRVASLLIALLLSAGLLGAHGAAAGGHMMPASGGDVMVAGNHDMSQDDAENSADRDPGTSMLTMCLAIAQAAALTLGAVALAAGLAAGLLRLCAPAWPAASSVLLPVAALVCRARPPDLIELQVSRR